MAIGWVLFYGCVQDVLVIVIERWVWRRRKKCRMCWWMRTFLVLSVPRSRSFFRHPIVCGWPGYTSMIGYGLRPGHKGFCVYLLSRVRRLDLAPTMGATLHLSISTRQLSRWYHFFSGGGEHARRHF